ncbi:MAG: hypothetical protein Fur0019_14170 [Tibeticola sp.]
MAVEDLNDHKAQRGDVLMQTELGRDEALDSAPTFSRLENRATRARSWALHEVLAVHRQPRPAPIRAGAGRRRLGYIVGPARNARLHAAVEVAEAALADLSP